MSALEKGSEKWLKKRGYYFFSLESDLANKFQTSQVVINEIRKYVIHKKMSYIDMFAYFSKKAQKSAALNPPITNTLATKITSLLKRVSTDDLDEITHLTKFDWDYIEELKPDESDSK